MLKHFGGFLTGLIIGVLIVAVALVGGGYLLLTKEGSMKKVEETVGAGIGMDLNEEQEKLSILDYGKGVMEIFGNLSGTPIKEIEAAVGINKISTTISDAVGIEASVIGESSISELGATLTDNLTMSIMQDKFEVELPDLPLFQDEDFLATPISEAFGDLDQNTLDSFIEVVYDEEATAESPASSKLIQKLGKKTIKEVSEGMDEIIQDTAIGEVIEIGEGSAEVLAYLKDTKLSELDGAIKDMTIGDAITVYEEDDPENGIKKSSKVLIYLKGYKLEELDSAIKQMTIGDAVEITEGSSKVLKYLASTTLDGIDGAIKVMTIGEAVEITEDSHAVMKALADLTLEELGDKDILQGKIDTLKLGDVVTVDDSSATLLKSLADTEIGSLSNKIDSLTLKEVMDKYDRGVLALVDPDTEIQEIGPALNDAVTKTSLYALRVAGVFSYELPSSYTYESLISRIHKNNSTPNEIVGDFTDSGSGVTKSITHSVYLAEGTPVNTTFYAFVSNTAVNVGYEGAVDITALGIEKNSSGAYVLTPEAVAMIFAAKGLSEHHNLTFFVDDGIDIEIQASADENGVYGNYDKLFSIMYDLSDEIASGTLYIGKGVRSETSVGGCVVYTADAIKVLDANEAYVDYVQGEALPIALKQISKEDSSGAVMTGYNTWVSAYTEYQTTANS